MLNFKLEPHTVILTCGPSGCGKTHFVKENLIPILQENYTKHFEEFAQTSPVIQYISSDDQRYQLLQDQSHNKLGNRMLQVSKQAFSLLENQLLNYIQYPVNTHFVIVDSTGLNKDWRKKIINTCRDNNYKVVLALFDFDSRKDYQKFSSDGRLTEKHVKRFYEDVIPILERHEYDQIIKVNKHYPKEDLPTQIVNPETITALSLCHLKKNKKYFVLGDIHGCFHTFKKFIDSRQQADAEGVETEKEYYDAGEIVLCGDVIDKGKYSKEILRYCLDNRDRIKWVVGNHERFVNDYFKTDGGSAKSVGPEILSTYFTCVEQYKDDEEFKQLLADFVSKGYPFLKTQEFIVTHAPCENKYLEKIDKESVKKQQNIRLQGRSDKDGIEQQLKFISTEAEHILPYHIFGHVSTINGIKRLNKFGIDTDCVSGNGLTICEVKPGRKPLKHFIETAPEDLEGREVKITEIDTLFDENEVILKDLDSKVQSRINWLCENKVNYISGTMSPASQLINEVTKEVDIESLEQGLNYFKSRGVKEVILEPKYMGSRCNVYLTQKTADCYMTSRNGYVIKRLHKPNITIDNFRYLFKQMKEQSKIKKILDDANVDYLILDGELLPWYALGKGLIRESYKPNHDLVLNELKQLEENEFYKVCQDKLDEMHSVEDLNISKLIKEKYNVGKTYEALLALEESKSLVESEDKIALLRSALKKFKQQIDIFGKPGNIDFKPFSILKIVYKDGTEKLPNYATSFFDISEDVYCRINFTDENWDKESKYLEFWQSCVEKNLEGVVIKPILDDAKLCKIKNIAPYLKVRNKEYLRLVYGYDYLENKQKYSKLAYKKNIKRKIEVSINEFDLGLRMLQTPYNNISKNNDKYRQPVAKMILEEENEKLLDPRL